MRSCKEMVKLVSKRYPIITHAKNVSNLNRLNYLAPSKAIEPTFIVL
jgi:hypothetical protein